MPVDPIDPHAVFLRIRSLVEMNGGATAVAAEANLKLPTLEVYLRGTSLPGAMALAQLARALRVSADFLLFGEVR